MLWKYFQKGHETYKNQLQTVYWNFIEYWKTKKFLKNWSQVIMYQH